MKVTLYRNLKLQVMDNNSNHIHNFWVIGVNYKKSDALIRGLFAVSNEQYEKALQLAPQYGISDIFIVSTCNRTEVYGFADTAEHLMELLCNVCEKDIEVFAANCYKRNAQVAIQHLFHVAAGLDSQILGDFEILGQIKTSVKFAKAHGYIGTFLERLLNCMIQSCKSIKTNTSLSSGTISVAFAAVQYIKDFYAELKHKKIVILGTGKFGRTVCRNIVDYLNVKEITLLNRTEESAIELANELHLKSAPFADLEKEVADASIVLVSTSAHDYILTKSQLEGRGEKLIIDLSVPRNVDIEAADLEGITLIDVDLLSKIKDETLSNRKLEIPKAIAIIDSNIAEFTDWYEMRKYAPALKNIKEKLKDIYISPNIFMRNFTQISDGQILHEEKINKVVGSLAMKMRNHNLLGCHFISAINDFIN